MAKDTHCQLTSGSKIILTMDIRSILSTPPPRESHPPESSSGYSANNPQPTAKTTPALNPSINFHSTIAINERPVLGLDTIAQGILPYDDMYDDSRHNSPEVNADPGKELPDLPPFQESNVRSEPLTSPENSQLVATNPAAPTSGAGVHRTTRSTFSDAWSPALPSPKRDSPLDYRPSDRTTPATSSSISVHEWTPTNPRDEPQHITPRPRTTFLVAFRGLETTARSSNRIPNNATDAWTARPDAAARNSNWIPDGAEIHDVDAWEAQRRLQVTHQPSDLSPQASSRTLSGSDQTAVDNLASNSHSPDISGGSSGSRTANNAKYENGSPLSGPELEGWLYIDIDTAIREKFDDQLGAALLCRYASDSHKQDEIRKGKQEEGDAPLPPLFPSIENHSTAESESSDGDEANVKYIYNVRPHTLTSNGTGVTTIKAHPGNAVWQLVQNRLGSVNDSRRWEVACHNCSTISDSDLCLSCTEERERTISPEEAAVDDKKDQTAGAALALASGQAASSRSRSKVTRQANGNVNSNANETQTRPSPPPPPPSRPSRRTRRVTPSEPEIAPPAPAPAASSRRHSHCERLFGRVSAGNPDQAQTLDNGETKEANNADDRQGWRGGKKGKKSVSWDPKENGQTNSKRKASDAVEDIGGGRIRARARRRTVTDSSNAPNELGASQQSQRVAASRTLAADPDTGLGAGTPTSGINLTIPDLVVARAPDSVIYSMRHATLAPSATPSRRLTLRVVAEANPDHPDHGAYLMRRSLERSIQRG